MSLKTIYTLLTKDLKAVNQLISDVLLKDSGNYTKEIVDYVIENQGKQVRPLLVLLIFKALSVNEKSSEDAYKSVINAAASIELIHIASLIHDDILDHASERRNKPSLNIKWGTESALVIGVYFYSTSLKLMAASGMLDLVDSLGSSVKAMCEGELDQLSGRDNFDLDIEDYISIIKSKTAVLFSTAALSGALPLGVSKEVKETIIQFGLNLGCLFQLTDDYLDLFGDGTQLKKKMGQDFFEGQFTLPFILLRDALTGDDLNSFKDLWKIKPDNAIESIVELMDKTNVVEQCKSYLYDYHKKTLSYLDMLDKSVYRNGLITITDIVLERAVGGSTIVNKILLNKLSKS
jgi:geranylgeranyl pyrophosphate synthase